MARSGPHRSLAKALTEPEAVKHLQLNVRTKKRLALDLAQFVNLESLHLEGPTRSFDLDAVIADVARCPRLDTFAVVRGEVPTVPESVGLLTQIRRFEVWDCGLTALPDALFELAQLGELMVHRHALTELPSAIARLRSLTALCMMDGALETLPNELGEMPTVFHLLLSGNALKRLPDSLAALKRLAYVYLQRNPLVEAPAWLASIETLARLEIDEGIGAELARTIKARRPYTTIRLHRPDWTEYEVT